jgi:LAS superfamily LD-carboxypeptidase LdcB
MIVDMQRQRSSKSSVILRALVVVLIAAALYCVYWLQQASTYYADTLTRLSKEPVVAETVEVGATRVKVANYELFDHGVWTLVSKARPLKDKAGFRLVDIPVKHGDADTPMKVAAEITEPLRDLTRAADKAGEPLMVSSAYRSLDEQRTLLRQFITKNGKELAAQYVSPVGTSEHHTGLSVDFSSVSGECAEVSDACSLSVSGAEWLADNAATYGFIQRYPEGESAITGVAFEPWHFRYVGVPLATALSGSDVTLDEFVKQVAPGYGAKQ